MQAVKRIAATAMLALALFFALLLARRLGGFEGYDPYWIDYNKPGTDITSEGP